MFSRCSKIFSVVTHQYGNFRSPATASLPSKLSVLTRTLHAVSGISSRQKPPFSAYVLLIIPGSAFCLGCWQVQRRQWKLNIIKELENKMNQPPVQLPNDHSELSTLEYRRVFLKGTFDHSKEMLYGPRPALYNGRYKETGSLVSSGSSGFCIITPFKLSDTGETILVNRGWVPKKLKDPNTRLDGQVEGEQELTGVVRLGERRTPFMPKSTGKSSFFLYRDVGTMSAVSGSLPVFVDACEGVENGPLAGQTRVTLRNEHLSYLLTWYSLSFVTSFLWYRRYINPKAFI
ncbi:Surfeit locus 1/Shy1 [Trinorchestia longiramus]|nr:Surfeit locus 1/Shy1 [Trinorchestia longiramus]